MSHEKTIHDGKKLKSPLKKLKERRAQRKAEKRAKNEDVKHSRKPRHKVNESN
jgi:hypothetical protein